MFDTKGRTVIVTGSAQGFGREFAERLLRDGGAKVCLSDVNEKAGLETSRELGEKYSEDRVHFVKCDVSKGEDWETLWTEAESKLGKVSVLINNAGINPSGGWKKCLDIMLYGVSYGTMMAIEKMGKTKGGDGGRIINIASLAGIMTGLGPIEQSGYTMAKWGTVALTRSVATSKPNLEKVEGIKSYALCPWFADTQLVRDMTDIKRLEKGTKQRVLTVQDVGNAFVVALKRDVNGACYGVFPDCPLMDFPNSNTPLFYAYALLGQKLFQRMGLEVIGPIHLGIVAVFMLLLVLCLGKLIGIL